MRQPWTLSVRRSSAIPGSLVYYYEMADPTFKDRNLPLQHLARELKLLREHNLTFRAGDPQEKLLLFAEASVVCLLMEHFIRVVLGSAAAAGATLYNLLEMANARGVIALPGNDPKDAIKRISNVRNTMLHGNYEQAAQEAGCASVEVYFKTVFASEVEAMFEIADGLLSQIDPVTGKKR